MKRAASGPARRHGPRPGLQQRRPPFGGRRRQTGRLGRGEARRRAERPNGPAFPEPKDAGTGWPSVPTAISWQPAGRQQAYVWEDVAEKKLAGTIREHTDWVRRGLQSRRQAAGHGQHRPQRPGLGGGHVEFSWNASCKATPCRPSAFSPDGQLLSWASPGRSIASSAGGSRWTRRRSRHAGRREKAQGDSAGPQYRYVRTSRWPWFGDRSRQAPPPQPRMLCRLRQDAQSLRQQRRRDPGRTWRLDRGGRRRQRRAARLRQRRRHGAALAGCRDRLLATLVQLAPAGDWLIVAAPGYFATSSPAAVS